jgi:hypothetical protein
MVACPAADWEEASLFGQYAVSYAEPVAHLVWPLDPKDVFAARALAEMFNAPSGWLERALLSPSLVHSTRAAGLGQNAGFAAFTISVATNLEQLDAAIQQVRALVDRVQSALPSVADYRRLEQQRAARRRLLDPRERLIALGNKPLPPLAELRRVAGSLAQDRVFVVRAGPAAAE